MRKQYRILKDTPCDKTGDLLVEDGNGYVNQSTITTWNKNIVENNPEWFEEVKEDIKTPCEYFDYSIKFVHFDSFTPRGVAIHAINTAMIDAYNQAIQDALDLGKQQTTITRHNVARLTKPKNFKF